MIGKYEQGAILPPTKLALSLQIPYRTQLAGIYQELSASDSRREMIRRRAAHSSFLRVFDAIAFDAVGAFDTVLPNGEHLLPELAKKGCALSLNGDTNCGVRRQVGINDLSDWPITPSVTLVTACLLRPGML